MNDDQSVESLPHLIPILAWEDADLHRRRLLHARRAELVERDRSIGLEREVAAQKLLIDSLLADIEGLLGQLEDEKRRANEAEEILRSVFASRRWRLWARLDRLRR